MLSAAFTLPSLDRIYEHLPVVRDIVGLLHRLPDSVAELNDLLDRSLNWNPLAIVAAFAVVAFVIVTIRRKLKLFMLLMILIPFASLLVLPSGWAVIKEANKVEIKKRPICVGEAILNGAVWASERIHDVKACYVPPVPKKRALDPRSKNLGLTDDGQDGKLRGKVEGYDWISVSETIAPTAEWRLVTQADEATNWISTFIRFRGDAYEISACPTARGGIPARIAADRTGQSYVDFLAEFIDAQSVTNLLPNAASLERDRPGRVKILNGSGQVVGYLISVSGVRGECAVISGPYRLVAKNFVPIRVVSAEQRSLLTQIARTTTVAQLQKLKSGD